MATIIQTVDGVVANRFDIKKAELKFGRTSITRYRSMILPSVIRMRRSSVKLEIKEKPAIFSKIWAALTALSSTKKKLAANSCIIKISFGSAGTCSPLSMRMKSTWRRPVRSKRAGSLVSISRNKHTRRSHMPSPGRVIRTR